MEQVKELIAINESLRDEVERLRREQRELKNTIDFLHGMVLSISDEVNELRHAQNPQEHKERRTFNPNYRPRNQYQRNQRPKRYAQQPEEK